MKGVELYAKVRYAVRIEGMVGARRDAGLASTHGRWRRCCRFPYRLDTGAAGRRRVRSWILLWGSSSGSRKRTSLQDGATVDALRAVCDLDLSDLQAIDPPRGFGRD